MSQIISQMVFELIKPETNQTPVTYYLTTNKFSVIKENCLLVNLFPLLLSYNHMIFFIW